MKRRYVNFKETYEEIGPNEYNEVNPYQRALYIIRQQYPDAKVCKTETIVDIFETETGTIQVPVFIVRYETRLQ